MRFDAKWVMKPTICQAYTSQYIALTMIALTLSDDNQQKVARRREIIDGLFNLSSDIRRALATEPHVKKLATEKLAKAQNLILLGRGYQAATCLEGALKIKEVSYIHAEGIQAGELKHGPLALIDADMPMMLFMPKDRHYSVSFTKPSAHVQSCYLCPISDNVIRCRTPKTLSNKSQPVSAPRSSYAQKTTTHPSSKTWRPSESPRLWTFCRLL